jgi:tetratricopeptide (TPR) repeat protein
VDERYHYIEGPKPELYELAKDPAEKRDLAAAETEVLWRMRSELARVPAGLTTPGAIDPAAAERLASLGYVGTVRARGSGPLPNPRDRVYLLGRIRDGLRLADQKRFDEAVATLRGVLRESPDMVDVWTKLGEVYRRMGRLDDSAGAYAEALRRSPAPSADMVLALAQAELARGRLDQAEAQARAVREGNLQTAGELLLAEIAIRRGHFAEALRVLDDVERRANEQKTGRVYRLQFLRGDALARLARVADAEAAYRREIAAFPSHLQAYANLAVLYFVQGRRPAVQTTLEDMARANPDPSAYDVAAKTWEALGDRKAATAWRNRK